MGISAKYLAAIFVCLFSISLSNAADKLSPISIKGATTITAKQAKAFFEQEVAFVDVRKDKDWDAGRVPGAIHIELKKMFNKDSLSKSVKANEKVVIYCNGPKCMRSSKASKKAAEWGYKKVYYFRGGIPEWKAASLPVE